MMDLNLLLNYLLMFLVGILFVFMLRKDLLAWFQVKTSRGNKVLVKIIHPMMDYYRAGRIDNNFLYYKGRKRRDNPSPDRMISLHNNSEKGSGIEYSIEQMTYKSWGVSCIDVDDAKDCVMIRKNGSYESVSGFNAEAYDNAQQSALNKPSLQKGLFDEKMWQIISICAFLLIIGLAFMAYQKIGTVDAHVKLVYNSVEFIKSNMTGQPFVPAP